MKYIKKTNINGTVYIREDGKVELWKNYNYELKNNVYAIKANGKYIGAKVGLKRAQDFADTLQ